MGLSLEPAVNGSNKYSCLFLPKFDLILSKAAPYLGERSQLGLACMRIAATS